MTGTATMTKTVAVTGFGWKAVFDNSAAYEKWREDWKQWLARGKAIQETLHSFQPNHTRTIVRGRPATADELAADKKREAEWDLYYALRKAYDLPYGWDNEDSHLPCPGKPQLAPKEWQTEVVAFQAAPNWDAIVFRDGQFICATKAPDFLRIYFDEGVGCHHVE